MARLSAGKSTGTTDKKTSRRLVGGVGGGSGSASTSLAVGKIETPSLVPRADVIDSFIQTNVPEAPGVTSIPTPPRIPDADPNLKRLANELGALNKNLVGAVTSNAKYDAIEEQRAREEAAGIVAQEGSDTHPEQSIAKISQKLLADKNNVSLSTAERTGAEKLLNRITNNGRLQRHIESQSRIRAVQAGALSLATKAQGATIETKDANNEPIVIRLESLSSDDPLYRNWVKENIYGPQYLEPSEYKQLQPIITNAIAQDIARQDKANKAYQLEEYQTNLNQEIDGLGQNLATAGPQVVGDVTLKLQSQLNRMRAMIPWVSSADQTKLRSQIPTLLIQSFIKHNKTQDESIVREVLEGLAIGPEESRYITKTEIIDGKEVTTRTLNPKQSWVNSLGGENWLMIQLSNAKYQLSEADRKGDLADTHFGSEQMEERINAEVAPLMVGPNKDLVAAKNKLQELKTEYLTTTTGNVSSEVQGLVLKDADQIFTNLQRVDSFDVTDDILEASKLVAGAKISVQKNAQLEQKLIQLEKRYPGNKQVTEFITKTRANTSVYETQEFKQYYKGVTERIKKIKDRWDKYAKLSTSYGQNDTAIEDGMWTTSRVKLDDMGTEIILRNLRNGTPEKIKDELAKALVRSNVDLLEEQERPWTPERGSHFEGNADTSLNSIFTSYEFLPGGLKPADRRSLNMAVKNSHKPVFPPQVTMEMATLAMQGKMDPRLITILKETGVKPGDFFVQQFAKFHGYIRLSQEDKQKLLELNRIKL